MPLSVLGVHTGIVTLRAEWPADVSNVMLWCDGALLGEGFNGWLTQPPGITPLGYACRVGMTWFELDLDTADFPAGNHEVTAAFYTGNSLAGRERTTLTISPPAVPAPPPPPITPSVPAFRDPRTGRATFLRAVFGLNHHELAGNPDLGGQAKAAGVNCLFSATGLRAADFGPAQEQFVRPTLNYLDSNDWILLGDQMDWTYSPAGLAEVAARSDEELHAAFVRLKASGRVLGVDLCDETPLRHGPESIPTMRRITAAARKAGLPVSWTTGPGLTAASGPRWNEGADLCDYLSLGIDAIDWRHFQPPGPGVGQWGVPSCDQIYRAIREALGNRYTRTDCARLVNVSICGKAVVPPYRILASIGYAITLGAAGVKVYHLDTAAWKANRQTNPEDQTGASPDTNAARWEAMGHALNAAAGIEDLILQPAVACPSAGRWWATRATCGGAGKLWLAVNRLERAVPLPPRPEGYSEAYVLTPTGKVTDVIGASVPPGGWVVLTQR